jgi:hypothetical protein
MPGEDHALAGELIQIRSRELLRSLAAVLPKYADIAGAQIVA